MNVKRMFEAINSIFLLYRPHMVTPSIASRLASKSSAIVINDIVVPLVIQNDLSVALVLWLKCKVDRSHMPKLPRARDVSSGWLGLCGRGVCHEELGLRDHLQRSCGIRLGREDRCHNVGIFGYDFPVADEGICFETGQ